MTRAGRGGASRAGAPARRRHANRPVPGDVAAPAAVLERCEAAVPGGVVRARQRDAGPGAGAVAAVAVGGILGLIDDTDYQFVRGHPYRRRRQLAI